MATKAVFSDIIFIFSDNKLLKVIFSLTSINRHILYVITIIHTYTYMYIYSSCMYTCNNEKVGPILIVSNVMCCCYLSAINSFDITITVEVLNCATFSVNKY